MNKINKGIDLLKSKFMIKFKQKVFEGEKYNVKYVLDINKKSNDLLIVFTACTKVVTLSKRTTMKTRKFILARLLLFIVVNGAIVPLTWFWYFWKKYRHYFTIAWNCSSAWYLANSISFCAFSFICALRCTATFKLL